MDGRRRGLQANELKREVGITLSTYTTREERRVNRARTAVTHQHCARAIPSFLPSTLSSAFRLIE